MPKDDCFGMLYVVGVLSIALEVTNEVGFGTEFDSVVLGSDELTEGSSLDLSTKSCIVSLCAGTNETIISLSKGFPPESASVVCCLRREPLQGCPNSPLPHKLKGDVSGCVRKCDEAQGKDFGMIVTEKRTGTTFM